MSVTNPLKTQPLTLSPKSQVYVLDHVDDAIVVIVGGNTAAYLKRPSSMLHPRCPPHCGGVDSITVVVRPHLRAGSSFAVSCSPVQLLCDVSGDRRSRVTRDGLCHG